MKENYFIFILGIASFSYVDQKIIDKIDVKK